MIVTARYVKKKYRERKDRKERMEGGATPGEDERPGASSSPVGEVVAKKEESPEAIAEKKRMWKYRWKILFGLVAPFALQSLDTTIIASALPFIAQDFSKCSPLDKLVNPTNQFPLFPPPKTRSPS